MNKLLFACVIGCLGLCDGLAADPVIKAGSVRVVQDARQTVSVSYELEDADAVVTFDVLTNGVSVGAASLMDAVGDVGRRLSPGEHVFFWNPPRTGMGAGLAGVSTEISVKAWSLETPPDYIVVDLAAEGRWPTRYFTAAEAIPGGVTNDLYKTRFLILRKCPARGVVWRMGEGQKSSSHRYMKFTHDFYMGVYQLTQAQWKLIMGSNPSSYKNDPDSPLRPVETISYVDLRGSEKGVLWPTASGGDPANAVDENSFLGQLRTRTGLTFDLPTEAEFEFGARATVEEDLNTGVYLSTSGDYSEQIQFCAWAGQSGKNAHTYPVGLKAPNKWGIYDVHGNVWELLRDRFGDIPETATVQDALEDYPGATSGDRYCLRGAAYDASLSGTHVPQIGNGFRSKNGLTDKNNVVGTRLVLDVLGE